MERETAKKTTTRSPTLPAPSCLQPRLYVLGGMQGILSADDLGGAARLEGEYADPHGRASRFVVTARSAFLFSVAPPTGGNDECWLCWSAVGSHFFGSPDGTINLPVSWRVANDDEA